MVRKIVGLSDPGDSTHWGTTDTDYINQYLTGVDQGGTDPVTIATVTRFNTQKFNVWNPAGTFKYIYNSSAIAADRNVTLPLLTTDDTITFNAATQTLTNKTLTTPIISSISNTGTLTLPTSTDSLLGRATTDTLTNKTFDTAGTGNHLTSTSGAVGDILTIPSGTDFKRLAMGTAYQNLRSNSGATNVEWGDPPIFPSAGRMYGIRVGFNGSTAAAAAGFGGLLSTMAGGNGTGAGVNVSVNTTDGNSAGWYTNTSNLKGRAGFWGNPIIMRKFNPTFTIRFRLSQAQTGSQGLLYIGFINQGAQPTAGTGMLDTMLDTKIGVLFGFRSTDTVFKIISNNAQTLATYTTAGTPNSSATDTSAHTLSISLNDATPAINWSFDGVAMTSITDTVNSVPPTGTLLTPIFMLEAQTATSLQINEHWSQLYTDTI